MNQPVIHRDPEIQGGTPVFVGTRAPLKNLFDCLEAGEGLDQFLEDYPSVSSEQAVTALKLARDTLTSGLHGPQRSEKSHHMETPVISCSPDVLGGTDPERCDLRGSFSPAAPGAGLARGTRRYSLVASSK